MDLKSTTKHSEKSGRAMISLTMLRNTSKLCKGRKMSEMVENWRMLRHKHTVICIYLSLRDNGVIYVSEISWVIYQCDTLLYSSCVVWRIRRIRLFDGTQ